MLTLGYLAFVFNRAPMNQVVQELLLQFILVNGMVILLILPLIILTLILGLRVLTKLGEVSAAVAKGDFSQRVEGFYSPRTQVGRLVNAFNHMTSVIEIFFKFTNAALMNRIISGKATDEGKMYELSIMFGDAVGYTKWSIKRTPPQIFNTLNRYYTFMGKIMVQKFGGIIDKFIGDGIMAHFGFLKPEGSIKTDHVRDAIRSAVYTQKSLEILAHAIEKYQGAKPLQYRFGIASGKCLVGAIGARGIMLDYSLIGSVVNLASRVEGLASPGGLVIDKFTILDAGNKFTRVRWGGAPKLKGIVNEENEAIPVKVYHFVSFFSEEENELMKRHLIDIFTDEVILDLLLDVKETPSGEDLKNLLELKEWIKTHVAKNSPLPIKLPRKRRKGTKK